MTTVLPPEGASLETLLAEARKRFGPIEFEPVPVGGRQLELPQVADMPAYLERQAAKAGPSGKIELPLWAKIWPSCLILSMFLAKASLPQGDAMEIGAGVAAVGLGLAARGRKVISTDIDPGALLFSRIGALKNGLADKVSVERADYTRDDLGRTFPLIVGCEVLYNESHGEPLVGFLRRHLAGEGEVVLAMNRVRSGHAFFPSAEKQFDIMMKEVPITASDGRKTACVIYRLRAKS